MEDRENFIGLYSKHEPNIRRYVYSLLADANDIEDVMQETAMALWRKFDDYDPEQPFIGWALRFSYFEAMKQRERAQRRNRLCLETLELISEEFRSQQGALRDQRQALRFCLEKLPSEHRALIGKRYQQGRKIRDIAEEIGRPAKITYRLFDKIRKVLFECVSTRLTQEAL